ncbi:MAG: hypothetical protein ACJA2D_001519, partial [Pseudohongiellaceae bacterium]
SVFYTDHVEPQKIQHRLIEFSVNEARVDNSI